MTYLTIARRTADLLSITRPQSVVNSTDQQVRQLGAIINEEGQDLSSSFDWQCMRRQKTFTTTADPEQLGAVPDDWDRFIANSFFNRTTLRQMFGPITPQRWQAIQVYPQFVGVYLAFIQRDNKFLITPTPPADQTIAYEYVTKNWALAADGVTEKSEFTADTDTTILPSGERLIELGTRWRWLKAKGMPYAEDLKTYEMQKEQVQARDGGNTQINTGGDPYYNWRANIPEGNFPGN